MPEEERQYISSEAECRETTITDGFVLISCDGIWDEMDNNQAADICGRLLVKTANDPKANVADLFVEVRRAVSKGPLPSLSPRCRCACGFDRLPAGLVAAGVPEAGGKEGVGGVRGGGEPDDRCAQEAPVRPTRPVRRVRT